eukprot:929870-Pelagomonas_calceolata.AAC.4
MSPASAQAATKEKRQTAEAERAVPTSIEEEETHNDDPTAKSFGATFTPSAPGLLHLALSPWPETAAPLPALSNSPCHLPPMAKDSSAAVLRAATVPATHPMARNGGAAFPPSGVLSALIQAATSAFSFSKP